MPDGYTAADPRQVTVGGGGTPNSEETFVNDRTHNVIVIVCHEGTNDLAPSEVTNGEGTETSIGSADLPEGVDEEALCGIEQGAFGGKPHGEKQLTVDVGSEETPKPTATDREKGSERAGIAGPLVVYETAKLVWLRAEAPWALTASTRDVRPALTRRPRASLRSHRTVWNWPDASLTPDRSVANGLTLRRQDGDGRRCIGCQCRRDRRGFGDRRRADDGHGDREHLLRVGRRRRRRRR